MQTLRVAVVGAVLALLVVAGLAFYYPVAGVQECRPSTYNSAAKYQAQRIQIGAVTEYCLANPSRWANGITVAPDGSVWFGEQSVPGIGHLFSNGTVVEYPWPAPSARGSITGEFRTGIWGVAFWDGKVWGTDGANGLIFGIDPRDGSVITVNGTAKTPFPYTLAVSPDDSLWVTSLSGHQTVGRISAGLNFTVYSFAGMGEDEPLQIDFVNMTQAYMVGLDPGSTNKSGHLYSFNPELVSPMINTSRVGGNFRLISPVSVSVSESRVWVVPHLPANIVMYDTRSSSWTVYPTSTVSYFYTTLPYFVEAAGTKVWFNEHYGNRIGVIDPQRGTLTEYSETDPPVSVENEWQNDLTIAPSDAGLWFTSTTGNYIGFADGNYVPPFTLSVSGSNQIAMSAGETKSIRFQVRGSWSDPLQVQVSNSENYTSVPILLSPRPDKTTIPAGSGPVDLTLAVEAMAGLQPGRYTVAITVTQGFLSQTAYLFVTVGPGY